MALTQCCTLALCFPLSFAHLEMFPNVSPGELPAHSWSFSVDPLATFGCSTVTWDLALIVNRSELVIIAELFSSLNPAGSTDDDLVAPLKRHNLSHTIW